MHKLRSARGQNLISLMIAAILMGFVSAAVADLISLNGSENAKLFNKVDTVNAARVAIDRIGMSVRQARSVGDLQGHILPPNAPIVDPSQLPIGPSTNLFAVHSDQIPLAQLQNGTAALSSNSFPSAGDPFYGQGQVPAQGWPGPPWPPPVGPAPARYALSPTTLILQVPVFDDNGYPLNVQGVAANIEDLDTYVYQVLPDANNPGTFMMQVAGFPGPGSRMRITSQAQTLVRGIIGPRDPNNVNNVKVFQFVDKTTNTASDTVANANVQNINGVIVNLEVQRLDAGTQLPSVLAFRSQMFMRNNTQATLIGPPPSGP